MDLIELISVWGLPLAFGAMDEGTLDFPTGLMEEYENMAWMLHAHPG